MDRRSEASTILVHKYVPKPYGNHVGQYLCKRSVRKEDRATYKDQKVNCPKCLGIMALKAAHAA